MRIGIVILPTRRWSVARARWQSAEELGFDHAWTYDHLTWRELQNDPWFGAIPTLAAAATVTKRIRLGPLVASPNFRHPVPFAKELMTLDDLSEGRISLGLGAGGVGWDATALGQAAWEPKERADRFDEFVRLLDRLLTQTATNHVGTYYSATEARNLPGCLQAPRLPFTLAAEGPRAMRLAATFGQTWVTVDGRGAGPDQIRRFEDACLEVDRDPTTIRKLALLGFEERPLASVESFRDAVGRFEEMGFTDLAVHWPRVQEPFAGVPDILEAISSDLAPQS
jgi:alkanesulfonate monooxygenase SsuD/methylene tetrahydromethanopterin reductase-like flavin-dependent oxidoreductase (luciferase family)